ncbi:N-acetyltransferase [Roseibium polysiphoniae]|uniref:N-acetyltransferase n=1 Tax=Roseibium polysiphoniae TaxID=2571221 RepID=A0A944CFI8_9HYPH|nr:GNAT family N-acetyltransferase [Roseibium polysiphoniae]MBS8262436.1 N-acetyltransferase [Roseibium polysiphoniae]
MQLRQALPEDLPALLEIHNHAVRNLTAAWTDQQDTLEDRRRWLEERERDGLPVFVALDGQMQVLGYGSFGTFRARPGYRHTAEHTIYVAEGAQGKGVGSALLKRLIERARRDGFHVLVGAVDGENKGSLAFHQKHGFETSACLPQVGTKFGRWLDLYFVTLVLDDRASPSD